jgi:DNA-directed RNA polymerase sigma subunit (sigma70/sigma32)
MASIPEDTIETMNKIVRAMRQGRREIGRDLALEELAEKLAIPLENVRRVVEIATTPIRVSIP